MKFLNFFYNPFKPHIAQLKSGDFAVRKLSEYTWRFLDAGNATYDEDYWWYNKEQVLKYCKIKTKELALERLERYKKFKSFKDLKFSKRVP